MIKQLGFTDKIKELIKDNNFEENELARVIAVHKERYVVRSSEGIFRAEITGNLRYTANSSLDFPTVGDWVSIALMDKETAIILNVLERISLLERQAVGKHGERQLIAANIDYAFVAMAVNQDFNLNRLDRYVSICNGGGITPIVLLTKTDLISPEEEVALQTQIQNRHRGLAVHGLSIENETSFHKLTEQMKCYKTYCFVGSSGVGKSTIINRLLNSEELKTSDISSSNQKGKHTTTHRELIILPNGSIVIDTPGMREVGITSNEDGIESAFDQITQLSEQCKFSDCSHTSEVGCAVIEAVESGVLPESSYMNYLKLKREQEHFSSTEQEKRNKDKAFGKMVKLVKAQKKKNKF